MKQYFLIYKKLLQLNFATLVAYRANFINSAISTIGWGCFSVISILLLTSRSSSLYGWSREELLLLTAAYNIIVGLFHVLFSRNFERFSKVIHFGELDNILVKPKDSQFLLSFWLVNYTGIFRVIIGIGLALYILPLLHISVTSDMILMFILLSLAGTTLLYTIWFLVCTTMLWFTTLSNLIDLLYDLNGITRYPAEMYRQVSLYLFFFLLPFTVIITMPTKVLLRKILPLDILLLVGLCIIFLVLSRLFWRFALRSYTSVSG